MPHPATFTRRSVVPYYVVFKTTPYSRALAAEIMADATIAVSLVRRVSFTKPIPTRSSSETERIPKTPSLRTTFSSGDLGSFGFRSKQRSRPPIPNMPLLDIAAAVTGTSSSQSQSQPGSPITPTASSPSDRSFSAPSSPDRGGEKKSSEQLRRSNGRFFRRVAKSAPPALMGVDSSRPGFSDGAGVGDLSDTASIHSSIWRTVTGHKPLPSIPQDQPSPPLPPLPPFATTTSSMNVVPTGSPRHSLDRSSTSSSEREWLNVSVNEAGHKSKIVTIPEEQKQRLSDSRTLHTDVSVGFPKRPKGRTPSPGSHPSIKAASLLPDGLYRGRIPLQKGWFPSVKWNDFNIDVSPYPNFKYSL